jgi:hypothetical protein
MHSQQSESPSSLTNRHVVRVHPKKYIYILDEAAVPGSATQASFVNGALRELSVDLCMDNFLSYRASVCLLARSSGASFRAGVSVPTDECVE